MSRRSALVVLAALAALTSAAGPIAELAFPLLPPDDPDYDRWETGESGTSFFDDQWELRSITPRGVRLTDQASGLGADEAWKLTTGRRDVVVAVLDSGIKWGERDLVNQFYLNRGELPEPQDAQGRSTVGVYDRNGDGAFDVKDYADDPRFGDANGNGILDPGDLIAGASDGTDADGNGYVDDISGWDFFEHDNDPLDNVDFGHGTGRAKEAAAQGNNGIGGIGVAPGASVLPVRIGDSFVVDVNDFAQGVLFAADSGARVVLSAVGSVNNSRFAREAVGYAHDRGVVFMASAADENSFHHNFPSTYDGAVTVKAIVPDSYVPPLESRLAPLTRTFQQHSGCANYGPGMHLALPSTSCSSGATGLAGGLGALVVSRGLDLFDRGLLSFPLTAEEVKQVVTASADDVFEPGSADSSRLYPSQPGWDQYYGYGRANAHAAVLRVGPGTIPPEADLRRPGWFETLDPQKRPVVAISGRVAAARAASYTYTVEYGLGVEPREEDFVLIAQSHERHVPFEGVLTHWDIRGLLSFADRPAASPNDFTVTLRLRVLDEASQAGEDRMTVFVHRDPDLRAGFPAALGASGESSPALADLDGDGAAEIVVATADGLVAAYRADGGSLPGWPVFTDRLSSLDRANRANYLGARAYRRRGLRRAARGAIMGSVAVGDVTGSGRPQVVVADLEGKVYAWDASGGRLPGFPVSTDPAFSRPQDRNEDNVLDRGVGGAPALGDLDGDGVLDIVVAAMDQRVYAWKGDGTPVAGWPALARDLRQDSPQGARIVSSPALGDLDGDGGLDVVVGTNEIYGRSGRVYAFARDGRLRRGWPVKVPSLSPEGPDVLPLVGQGVPSAPALADVDGDGRLEVGIGAIVGPGILFRANGRRFVKLAGGPGDFGADSRATDGPSLFALTSGAFGDLDGDGGLDLVAGTAGLRAGLAAVLVARKLPFEHHLSAWNARTGAYLPAFPVLMDDYQFFVNPAIADIDGDGLPEVISGSGGYLVHAFNHLGREPVGWPKFTGHWLAASPAVGDLDGDGLLEVVITTREGSLYVWNTPGPVQVGGRPAVQWGKFHHDLRNSGHFASAPDPAASRTRVPRRR
jgi:subtilase family protein/VCBS repeat protein